MILATIAAIAPALTVKLDGSTVALPARNQVTGYTPAVSDRVFVESVAGRLYVFFKAV